MKFKNVFAFLQLLEKELGSDLVYSLSLDEGKAIVSIATHKSERVYHHGRQIQSCQISLSEFKRPIEDVTKEIASKYRELLRGSHTLPREINGALNATNESI